jgi:choloylglycine hydrolase
MAGPGSWRRSLSLFAEPEYCRCLLSLFAAADHCRWELSMIPAPVVARITLRRSFMRTQPVRLLVVVAIVVLVLPHSPVDACTSFLLKGSKGPLMAKNFDWDVAAGMLMVNPRGLAKTSLVPEGAKPVRWTSRYGSITFNQYGREFPLGGMNEAGLAMEVLWLAETEYTDPGERQAIGALQWVQYCLDSFRSISDVAASSVELAISSNANLHFIACDKSAECAVIEFLDGELVGRSSRTLPLPVLTNDPYNASLAYLNRTLGYGGDPISPEGPGSLPRFARAARGLHEKRARPGENPVDDAFTILADVAQPTSTQWSIVYQLAGGVVHYTSSTNPERRTLDLNALDLDCTADPLVIDLATPGAGDVTSKLAPYSTENNLELIRTGFSADSLTAPPDEFIQTMATYPDGLLCTFEAPAQ